MATTLDDFDILEVPDISEVWLNATDLSDRDLSRASRLICREYPVSGFYIEFDDEEKAEIRRFLLGTPSCVVEVPLSSGGQA